MAKGNFEPEKESITKGQAFWGLLVFIGLIAAVVVWFSSLLSGDVMEATDYVSKEAVEAFKEVVVEEGAQVSETEEVAEPEGIVVENLGVYKLELLESVEGDWRTLRVLDSEAVAAEEYGITVDGLMDETFFYLRVRYPAEGDGFATFYLPGDREGLKAFLHDVTQPGDNEWIVRLRKDDWVALVDAYGIDQLGLALTSEEVGTENKVYIFIPEFDKKSK